MKRRCIIIIAMLTLLLSSFKVSAQEGEIEAGYIEIEDIGKDMQLEAISTKKVDKIQMSQYGKQVIPSKPLKASEDIVNKGIPLYRISIKVKAFDASNKIVSNAKITVSTTSTGVVKGMKTSGYTDSKGEGYIYVDVRGAATFSITAHINNTKKTEKYKTVESCVYEEKFYTTAYITALESDYKGKKVTASGITGETFREDFLAAVKLNGSGVTEKNIKILYNASTKKYGLGQAKTSSGTIPTAGRTIAVDNFYIPRYRVSGSTYKRGSVNISGIGIRVAEDAGGAINQYDIDVYMGVGNKSKKGFSNMKRTVTYLKTIVG